MFRPSNLLRLVVVAVLGCVGGCSGGPVREFAPVEGRVTLNGRPLVGVIVKFYPESESTTQPPIAAGTTDETGTFQLSISEKQLGALVGPNVAVVRWPMRDRSSPPLVSDVPIPLKYTDLTANPLRFDVKAGPGQTINLELVND
jgi:hypothetical protein